MEMSSRSDDQHHKKEGRRTDQSDDKRNMGEQESKQNGSIDTVRGDSGNGRTSMSQRLHRKASSPETKSGKDKGAVARHNIPSRSRSAKRRNVTSQRRSAARDQRRASQSRDRRERRSSRPSRHRQQSRSRDRVSKRRSSRSKSRSRSRSRNRIRRSISRSESSFRTSPRHSSYQRRDNQRSDHDGYRRRSQSRSKSRSEYSRYNRRTKSRSRDTLPQRIDDYEEHRSRCATRRRSISLNRKERDRKRSRSARSPRYETKSDLRRKQSSQSPSIERSRQSSYDLERKKDESRMQNMSSVSTQGDHRQTPRKRSLSHVKEAAKSTLSSPSRHSSVHSTPASSRKTDRDHSNRQKKSKESPQQHDRRNSATIGSRNQKGDRVSSSSSATRDKESRKGTLTSTKNERDLRNGDRHDKSSTQHAKGDTCTPSKARDNSATLPGGHKAIVPKPSNLFSVDSTLQKKMDATNQTRSITLKANSDSNRAEIRWRSTQAELEIAEFWLETMTQNLIDVGKRIELHDWKWKELLKETIDP